jgi:hypothetical protein
MHASHGANTSNLSFRFFLGLTVGIRTSRKIPIEKLKRTLQAEAWTAAATRV